MSSGAPESGESNRPLREYVGFTWQDDWNDKVGLLLYAADSTEASAVARATFGEGVNVSVWNREDAKKPR